MLASVSEGFDAGTQNALAVASLAVTGLTHGCQTSINTLWSCHYRVVIRASRFTPSRISKYVTHSRVRLN